MIRLSRLYYLILILLVFGQVKVQAQEEIPQPLTRILFVYDASQSMYGRWQSGLKVDVANKLMSQMLDSLGRVENGQFQLALRVYGHQKPVPPQDCDDTRLEIPFSFNNAQKIKRKLNSIRPKGTTPIARSLERAITDFPKCSDCRNIIILITDGIEACDEDPCAVSRLLQKQGVILKPFVIGIGLDPQFKQTFECVGNYYDATDEQTFKKVLNIVISQALDNTTAQVNLADITGRPTETDVPFALYDHLSGRLKYSLMHTLNFRNQPDTLILDPLVTYDMVVYTVPPVRVDSIVLTAGKHTHIGASTPRGTLELKTSTRAAGIPPKCIVRKGGQMQTLNVQDFNTTQKYLVGTYDIEILTLPRYVQKGIKIDQSKTTTIAIPPSGSLSLQLKTAVYGSIFQEVGDQLEWVCDLDPNQTRISLDLQPGNYRVVCRSKSSQMTSYSRSQSFTISSGNTSIVKIN